MWPSAGARPPPPRIAFHPGDASAAPTSRRWPTFSSVASWMDDDPALARRGGRPSRRGSTRGSGVTPLGIERPAVHRSAVPGRGGRSRSAGAVRCAARTTARTPAGRAGSGATATACAARGSASTRAGATGQRFWHRTRAAAGDRGARAEALVPAPPRPRSATCSPGSFHGAPTVDSRAELRSTAPTIDGRIDDAAYRAWWGAWTGREREFYRECARLVNALRWKDVVRVRGRERRGPRAGRGARPPRRRLHHDPGAARRRPAADHARRARPRVLVTTYNPFDPLELPRLLIEVLGYFDGRPTGESAHAHPPGAEHQRPAVAGATAGRPRRARGARLAGIAPDPPQAIRSGPTHPLSQCRRAARCTAAPR